MANEIAQGGDVCFGQVLEMLAQFVHQVQDLRFRIGAQIHQLWSFSCRQARLSLLLLWCLNLTVQTLLGQTHQIVVQAERHDGLGKL